jgi:hypothetical protein
LSDAFEDCSDRRRQHGIFAKRIAPMSVMNLVKFNDLEEIENWLVAFFEKPLPRFCLMFVVLMMMMPPTGALDDNEENYFQLAAQAVTGSPGGPNSAVFDASPHRFVSERLLGGLISLFGYESTEIITRTLTAAAFALIVPLLFRAFALSVLDAAIATIAFYQLGQSLIGGEWIFHGFESKVIAYGFVFCAVYASQTRRDLTAITLLCAIATYFHFLIGIFWFFALIGLKLIDRHDDVVTAVRRAARAVLLFVGATALQTGTTIWTRWFAHPADTASDTPTPDVIFSLIREPWHGAPFASRYQFAVDWLPGYMMAGAMLIGCWMVARTSTNAKQRNFAIWLGLLIAYLILLLIPAFIERHTGVMGKFYPFRPSSLILFLWILLIIAWINAQWSRHIGAVKLLTLALFAPGLFSDALSRTVHTLDDTASYWPEKVAIAEYLKASSQPDSVVLIDPSIENFFLDFERRTNRPSLVSWKLAPTNDSDLREWYRRTEFHKSLFASDCSGILPYRVDFLLAVPRDTARLTPSCGKVVLTTKHWRLIQR